MCLTSKCMFSGIIVCKKGKYVYLYHTCSLMDCAKSPDTGLSRDRQVDSLFACGAFMASLWDSHHSEPGLVLLQLIDPQGQFGNTDWNNGIVGACFSSGNNQREGESTHWVCNIALNASSLCVGRGRNGVIRVFKVPLGIIIPLLPTYVLSAS